MSLWILLNNKQLEELRNKLLFLIYGFLTTFPTTCRCFFFFFFINMNINLFFMGRVQVLLCNMQHKIIRNCYKKWAEACRGWLLIFVGLWRWWCEKYYFLFSFRIYVRLLTLVQWWWCICCVLTTTTTRMRTYLRSTLALIVFTLKRVLHKPFK